MTFLCLCIVIKIEITYYITSIYNKKKSYNYVCCSYKSTTYYKMYKLIQSMNRYGNKLMLILSIITGHSFIFILSVCVSIIWLCLGYIQQYDNTWYVYILRCTYSIILI